MTPMDRKVVTADGNSLGPVGEVHVKFQLGKVVFNNRFIILDNLKQDMILGLPWQSNYKIGCELSREVSTSSVLKVNFRLMA